MSADSYRRAVMRRPGRTFDDTHIAKCCSPGGLSEASTITEYFLLFSNFAVSNGFPSFAR